VKHSYLITDVNDIPRSSRRLFIAQTGRPGPVVIDIPKNVQQQRTRPVAHRRRSTSAATTPTSGRRPLPLNEIMGLIEKAERPVLYVGGGIITSGAAATNCSKVRRGHRHPGHLDDHGLRRVSQRTSALPRWLGMHGAAYANWAVSGEFRKETRPMAPTHNPGRPGADLLLAFGVRFDDRVTGQVDKFCEARHDRAY
jgi:acetolactate synthase I/II/III large subunit